MEFTELELKRIKLSSIFKGISIGLMIGTLIMLITFSFLK